MKYVESRENPTDVVTKPLASKMFLFHKILPLNSGLVLTKVVFQD